ncbi:hypothetical protein BDQ17DRAFT_1392858 [Cyathus striatus]|nr:hypothetical protein BDQ17DRAFT_1392858 [Cyathus striatus]
MHFDHSTVLNYSSVLNSFISFCHVHHFPLNPTPDTLSHYLIYQSHFLASSTLSTYLTGIVALLEPFFPNVRNACDSPLMIYTTPMCKPPLPLSTLSSICAQLLASTHHDTLLCLAVLTSAFFGLLHLGELTCPDDTALCDHQKLTSHLSVTLLPASSYQFRLPTHKADKFFEGNTLHSDGTPLTCSSFLSFLHHYAGHSFLGHSLHSGGATALADLGIPTQSIQQLRHWNSDTFQIYIHKHPALLSSHHLPPPHS